MHEVQTIKYFTAGCREGTLLKHRLLCEEPETLDELLLIADKHATADSSMKAESLLMRPATWHLRPLGLRLVRPVGDSI